MVLQSFLQIFNSSDFSTHFLNLMKRFLQKMDAHYFNSTASLTSLKPHIMLDLCSILLSALAY